MTDPMRPIDLSCDDVRVMAGAFVLGALEAAEDAAVRTHLATCSDAHAEIAEVGSVLPVLDASVPVVEPPAGLKARIMAAAAADLEVRGTSASQAAPPVSSTVPTAPPMSAARGATTPFPSDQQRAARQVSRTSPATWAMRIAAVLVIGVLAGWNFLLQGQLDTARTYERNVAAVLDVASQPGALTAVLASATGSGPKGLAAVGPTGEMAMAMRDLAPTTGNQVYEAWVIGADGVPVPLGGATVGPTGTAFFTGGGLSTEPGAVLALTLEPGPGAKAPSSTPVSSGTVVAATG